MKRAIFLAFAVLLGQAVSAAMPMPVPGPTPARAPAAGATYDELITALADAIRVSEPIGEVELPAELPRFQKADALKITLPAAKQAKWNETVEKIEDIIKYLKAIPLQMKNLTNQLRQLRDLYGVTP